MLSKPIDDSVTGYKISAESIAVAINPLYNAPIIFLLFPNLTNQVPIIEVIGLETYLIPDLSFASKIALVVGMALGRLEILVAISLITFGFNRD